MSTKQLISQFNDICNAIADSVNQQLFEGCRNYDWIGEVVGDVCDFDGFDTLTLTEMVIILKSGMTFEEYNEWTTANLDYYDTKGFINLQSWLRGCRHYMLPDKPKTT